MGTTKLAGWYAYFRKRKDVMETRGNVGVHFHDWTQLLLSKGIKFDAELRMLILE